MKNDLEEISCILINKEEGEYIIILDKDSGYTEFRRNNSYPFGLPISEIEEGCVFTIKTEYIQNGAIFRVEKADIFRYTEIVESQKLMETLHNYNIEKDMIDGLHNKIEKLRNNKIETIVDEK